VACMSTILMKQIVIRLSTSIAYLYQRISCCHPDLSRRRRLNTQLVLDTGEEMWNSSSGTPVGLSCGGHRLGGVCGVISLDEFGRDRGRCCSCCPPTTETCQSDD
jgi:hypothetical protein